MFFEISDFNRLKSEITRKCVEVRPIVSLFVKKLL